MLLRLKRGNYVLKRVIAWLIWLKHFHWLVCSTDTSAGHRSRGRRHACRRHDMARRLDDRVMAGHADWTARHMDRTPLGGCRLDDPPRYECVEIAHGIESYHCQGAQDPPVCGWRALTASTMERVRKFLHIHVTAYGMRKYTFKSYHYHHAPGTDNLNWGCRRTWCYEHCKGKSTLLIRQVPPSPEIHAVMKPYFDEWDGKRNKRLGSTVAAVAENERTILTYFVRKDRPCGHFKDLVKRRCVELGICTHQTHLTIYWDNVPMHSNMMLRKNPDEYHRHRLPKIIYAADGMAKEEVCTDTPQSRTEQDPDSEGDEPHWTIDEDTETPQSRTEQDPHYDPDSALSQIISEVESADNGGAAPRPKKRKTAAAGSCYRPTGNVQVQLVEHSIWNFR